MRPREGNAETGNVKLQKALSAKKMGKIYFRNYQEHSRLNKVSKIWTLHKFDHFISEVRFLTIMFIMNSLLILC